MGPWVRTVVASALTAAGETAAAPAVWGCLRLSAATLPATDRENGEVAPPPPASGYSAGMNVYTHALQVAAAGSAAGVIVVLVVGLAVAAALVWSVRFGLRVRRREQDPRRPDDPTHHISPPPDAEATPETRQRREPDEVPRAADESERLTPHDLEHHGSRPAENQTRPRWSGGSGGSFGSGGPGGT